MEETVIRVENVSKDFILPHEKVNSIKSLFTSAAKGRNKGKETQHALKDISFDIKKGEFFGIVGRNGSGKSTMLKILANIYQPTKGKVITQGKLVPFIELCFVFNPELTGRENVYLNGAMLGFSEKEVDSMYPDIVSFAELERFMGQKLKNYSSGMQVRLAFSMATRAHADILLVDEVLAVGDADFQRKCFHYFSKLKKNKTTVVFVSHNMDAVREYCDRAMLIDDSHIITIGQTAKVAEQYIKLFNTAESTAEEEVDERWGNGQVHIRTVASHADPKNISIKMTLDILADIAFPVIGFRIRNSTGEEITGTNTKIEQADPQPFKKGQKVQVEWSLKNILSDGKYYIDPSVINPDGTTVYDWWNEATILTIKKERHLPYGIDPGFTVSIS